MESSPKRGRPLLPKDLKKSGSFRIVCTEEESAILRKAAEQSGGTISQTVRMLIFKGVQNDNAISQPPG
jgi:hypothetical protein